MMVSCRWKVSPQRVSLEPWASGEKAGVLPRWPAACAPGSRSGPDAVPRPGRRRSAAKRAPSCLLRGDRESWTQLVAAEGSWSRTGGPGEGRSSTGMFQGGAEHIWRWWTHTALKKHQCRQPLLPLCPAAGAACTGQDVWSEDVRPIVGAVYLCMALCLHVYSSSWNVFS